MDKTNGESICLFISLLVYYIGPGPNEGPAAWLILVQMQVELNFFIWSWFFLQEKPRSVYDKGLGIRIKKYKDKWISLYTNK
jgi:hypothetical protein